MAINKYQTQDPKLFSELVSIIRKKPNQYAQEVKKNIQLMDWIDYCLPVLHDECYQLKTKIWWILNGIDAFPECINPECSNTFEGKNIKNINAGYPQHCCSRCAKNSSIRKQKYMQTCIGRYGVENISQSEETKQKKMQKSLDKYGVPNPAQAEEVKLKTANTCLEKYGTECTFQAAEVKLKIQQTCLDRYGETSFSKTDEYDGKVKQSNLNRFGVEYPNQDPEFRKNSQKKYIYDGIAFDSFPEIAFFIWLKDNNIDFEYQPDVSFEYEFNGKTHRYQPDFLVGGRYVELKGLQFFECRDASKRMVNPYDHSQDDLYEAKHQCMLKNDIQILTSLEYEQYVDYAKRKFGKDFIKTLKIN